MKTPTPELLALQSELNNAVQAIGVATVKKYNTTLSQLEDFSKKVWRRGLRFDEIDGVFLDKYRKFRADQGVGVNTIQKDIAVLKTWLKESYHRGVHENRGWEASFFKVKEVEVEHVHLTFEELELLENVSLPKKNKNNNGLIAIHSTLDLFLLACWTGARISVMSTAPPR